MGVLGFIRLLFFIIVGIFWLLVLSIQVTRLIITKRGKFFYKKNRKSPPPCLTNPVFGEHRNIQLKNVRLHYVESGPKDGRLMVMLHGFPEFWYSWRHQIKAFNRNYRVVAVDLRGYGGSSKPSSVSQYQVKHLVDDIQELIQKLGEGKPCILMGHDWGGAVTWSLASRYPNLVDKAVIMNCPHISAMFKFMQSSWKQFMKSWYMFLINLPFVPEWYFGTGDLKMLDNAFTGRIMGAKPGAFTHEDLEAFKYTFNRNSDFTGPMNYIRAAIRGYNVPRETGGRVTSPEVLLIWGTRDGALSKELAPLSAKYADRCTVEYVEGASHWVQQDEPQLVNKLVAKFLDN